MEKKPTRSDEIPASMQGIRFFYFQSEKKYTEKMHCSIFMMIAYLFLLKYSNVKNI